jgi:endonuclease/exonuclease/phosphatase family metal-dependent hydrolase
MFLLSEACINTACAKKKGGFVRETGFVVATWNIGHFSNGQKPYSTIDNSNYKKNLIELQKVLKDSLKADIICLNEFSEVFGSDDSNHEQLTKDLFFNDYAFSKIGPLLGFSCNSIFSNIKVKNIKLHLFEISKTVQSNMPRAANYYFLEGDLYLDGKKVKLVCAHTTSSASALCQSQIAELLNKYRNCDKVIMCGDWNTQDFSLFKNSGYNLANDGSYKTYPSKNYALDNIAVKGLEISDVRMVKTTVSDHYPLVCNISL